MEMEFHDATIVVTQGTTHINGMRTGYFFDFGSHVEFIPLMEQRRAFEYALSLLDEGKRLSFKNCSLCNMYGEIQRVQRTLAEELDEKLSSLLASLSSNSNKKI